jgi:hypothetical protein
LKVIVDFSSRSLYRDTPRPVNFLCGSSTDNN